jgi:hypothetical protein
MRTRLPDIRRRFACHSLSGVVRGGSLPAIRACVSAQSATPRAKVRCHSRTLRPCANEDFPRRSTLSKTQKVGDARQNDKQGRARRLLSDAGACPAVRRRFSCTLADWAVQWRLMYARPHISCMHEHAAGRVSFRHACEFCSSGFAGVDPLPSETQQIGGALSRMHAGMKGRAERGGCVQMRPPASPSRAILVSLTERAVRGGGSCHKSEHCAWHRRCAPTETQKNGAVDVGGSERRAENKEGRVRGAALLALQCVCSCRSAGRRARGQDSRKSVHMRASEYDTPRANPSPRTQVCSPHFALRASNPPTLEPEEKESCRERTRGGPSPTIQTRAAACQPFVHSHATPIGRCARSLAIQSVI